MTPAFTSWTAFFAMGGYGFFVWLAVSITLVSLAGLVLHTRWQRKQLLAEISLRYQREQRIKQSKLAKQEEIA